MGDMIWVKCIGIDERSGKVRLSRKAAMKDMEAQKQGEGGPRGRDSPVLKGVMRLLVTNDDGIGCVFLHELVPRAPSPRATTPLSWPPRVEQSWTGASKSRHRPVRSEKADIGLGCPTWVVDGTPSDCVNIGIDHLLPVRARGGPERAKRRAKREPGIHPRKRHGGRGL